MYSTNLNQEIEDFPKISIIFRTENGGMEWLSCRTVAGLSRILEGMIPRLRQSPQGNDIVDNSLESVERLVLNNRSPLPLSLCQL